MPLPIIPVPPFPNVPNLSGVPFLVREALNFPPSTITNIAVPEAATQLWAAAQSGTPWGILNDSFVTVVTPDSFLNFENRNEWRLSDYPVQQGSFASYNKVILPFEASVRLSKGGTLSERQAFIKSIDAIAGDTNLYTIFSPEKAYQDVNVTRYEVTRRGAEGAYFLCEVDIYFRQILQVPAQYSTTAANTTNAQNPAATPPVNQGTLQPGDTIPSAVVAKAKSAVAQALN